jgi:phosphoglycerol transferase MdoB-like AlkP superfamily enzyme
LHQSFMTRPFALNRRSVAPLISFLPALAAVVLIVFTESHWIGIALGIVFLVLLYGLFRCLFLGPFTAALVSAICIFAIYAASKLKFTLTARRLHPFDIWEYVNAGNLSMLKVLYPDNYLQIHGAIAAALIAVSAVLYFERFRQPTRLSVIMLVIPASLLLACGHYADVIMNSRFGDGNRFMHFNRSHVATFALSTFKSLPELASGEYFDYGPPTTLDPGRVALARSNSCVAPPNSPDIMVILRESIMIPATDPAMKAPFMNDQMFKSFDGQTYTLRVETYGGGSAFSIFSVLSGISSESFGGMKNLALDLVPGRIHYSLPMLMKACGYETIAVTMGTTGYVADEDFFSALGFNRYYDFRDILALSKKDHTDRAIYKLVGKIVDERQGPAPLFFYVDTTASHAPYIRALRPDQRIDVAERVADPRVREYIRRIMLGEYDLDTLMKRLVERSTPRPFVVLDFGDHQPNLTKDLPGHPGVVDESRDIDDRHLITFFRIRSWDYMLSDLPRGHPIVDIAYLGDWLLQALNFRITGLYELRRSFMGACKSRYWQCDDHKRAQELHQIMRAAGLISFD